MWSLFRLLNHHRASKMESMDISYGEAGAGNESTMIYDEEMKECSEENIREKEFAPSASTVPPDSNNTLNITPEISGSSNATVVLNSSFPNHSETGDSSIRFPLQTAKESNQCNILPASVNTTERLKANLMNALTPFDVPTPDKENIFAEPCTARINEFPTEAKRLSDAFPLDRPEIAPELSTLAGEEEQFTSASEYNFSAADFDCLLSRGCPQPTISRVELNAASSTSAVAADLPRNSVLINFDPLLRRQTILKPETKYSSTIEGVEVDPFPCLALVDFAQQQKQESVNQSELCDQIQHTSELQDNGTSELLLDNLVTPSTFSLETELVTSGKDNGVQQGQPLCSLLDASVPIGNETVQSELNKSSHNNTVIAEDSETTDSSKSSDHLLLTSSSLEHDVLVGEQTEEGEQLLVQINSDAASACPGPEEHSPDCTIVNELHPTPITTTHTESVTVEESQDSVLNIPSVTTAATVEITEKPIENITSIPNSGGASSANDDLTLQPEDMIAEPHPEKQNNTILNMSDDRATTNEDGYVEVGKKCKNEEVNIADMEKKMHDVELREESMLKRITEKDKIISKMSNVVEAYERAIAELISEKETLIRNHEAECENLKQDNEINAQHLESLEKTFSNLYAKYERMKKNAIKYKEYEEKLLEKVTKLEECLRAQEQRYEKMKSHAMSQLDIANTKLDEALRNHSQESAKFKAQIKKEELNRISINEQLIQKSKENEELLKICDELIKSTN
uniref:Transforming acidic coiled-coil-containing protein C-terminal domain-containing protein n=1 Tax=Anopheles farauti TaxID=69004 RepID=A0A182QPX5_9DIPT